MSLGVSREDSVLNNEEARKGHRGESRRKSETRGAIEVKRKEWFEKKAVAHRVE